MHQLSPLESVELARKARHCQLAAASNGNCRRSEPSCKSSLHWQRPTPPLEKVGLARKARHCLLPALATASAVNPHVSPVPTGKEAPTPPSGESGAGKKGQALPTASWQLPVMATASDGNCRGSEPSCKSSPHWQRGTHSSRWKEWVWQEWPGIANSQLATTSANCQGWQLPMLVVAFLVSPTLSRGRSGCLFASGGWTYMRAHCPRWLLARAWPFLTALFASEN